MKIKNRITRARVQLLLKYSFLGTLALNLRVRDGASIESCRTMGTDGRSLFYNSEFVEKIDEDTLQGTIAHELCHIILQHVLEWRRASMKEFPEIFTMAQEYVVNDMVMNMFTWKDDKGDVHHLKLPDGVFLDPAYSGMYTEQVYHELLKKLKPRKSQSFAAMLKEGMVDQHGLGRPQEGQEEGQKSQGQVEDGWASARELDQLARDIKIQIAQAATVARSRGKFPAGLEQIIGEMLEPQINWRVMLAEFLSGTAHDDYSWKTPNRRHLHRGIVLPALRSESVEIALMFDTSGSISVQDLTEAYSEARGIMSAFGSYTLHLIGCDAEVHSLQSIGPHDEPDLTELFKGRGGTSFIPPFKRLQEEDIRPSAAVYFTADANGTFPDEEPGYPVLWVVKDGAMDVPFGKTVRLD